MGKISKFNNFLIGISAPLMSLISLYEMFNGDIVNGFYYIFVAILFQLFSMEERG